MDIRNIIWNSNILIPQLNIGYCFCCNDVVTPKNFYCAYIYYGDVDDSVSYEQVRPTCLQCFEQGSSNLLLYRKNNYPENIYTCLDCFEESTHSFYCREHYVNEHTDYTQEDINIRFEMVKKRKRWSENSWEFILNDKSTDSDKSSDIDKSVDTSDNLINKNNSENEAN